MAYNKETEMWEGFIYCLTNRLNNKKYIGQTKNTVEWRAKQHLTSHKNYAISNAIRKYGKENFLVEQLIKIIAITEEELISKLNKEEIFCIDWYQTLCSQHGYNIDAGGGQATYAYKPVDQYDLTGNFINTYKSITDASMQTNYPICNISDCCHKDLSTAHGYIWRFHGEPLDLPKIIPNRPVDKYDLNGNLIQRFEHVSDISEDKLFINRIRGCCKKGKPYTVDGFVYRYPPDVFDTYPIESEYLKNRRIQKEEKEKQKALRAKKREEYLLEKHIIPGTNKIKQCEKDMIKKYKNIKIDEYNVFGELVCTYNDVYEVAHKNNTYVNNIINVCDGKKNSLKNKIYRYYGDKFDKYPVYIIGYDEYDFNLNYIRRWETSTECEQYYNIPKGSVNKAAIRKTSVHGKVFVKHGEPPFKPRTMEKETIIYSINDNSICKKYQTLTEAMRDNGCVKRSVGDFYRMLKSHNYIYNDYYWVIDESNYGFRNKIKEGA